MERSAAKTRAMMLLKQACDAGRSDEAFALLSPATTDDDASIDWTRVADRLAALVDASAGGGRAGGDRRGASG